MRKGNAFTKRANKEMKAGAARKKANAKRQAELAALTQRSIKRPSQ